MTTLDTTNRIQVRPMQDEDLAQVLEIDQHSFSLPWPASAYQYELHENPLSLVWVAEDALPDGRKAVIGMIVVWLVVDEAHIATIAVHPEQRGRGIGKRLLAQALKAAIHKGLTQATLEVRLSNTAAQNLYRRFRFDVVGERQRYYRDNNENALIMTVNDLGQSYLHWLESGDWKNGSG